MNPVMTDQLERELEQRYLGGQFHQRARHGRPVARLMRRLARHR